MRRIEKGSWRAVSVVRLPQQDRKAMIVMPYDSCILIVFSTVLANDDDNNDSVQVQ